MMKRFLSVSVITAVMAAAAMPAMAIEDMEQARRFCKQASADPLAAIAACTAFIERGDPQFRLHATEQRGRAYLARGWFAQALADFDEAVRIDPKFAGAWNNRGWTLMKMGRHQEALASIDRAISLKKDEKYLTNREIVLKKMAAGS